MTIATPPTTPRRPYLTLGFSGYFFSKPHAAQLEFLDWLRQESVRAGASGWQLEGALWRVRLCLRRPLLGWAYRVGTSVWRGGSA